MPDAFELPTRIGAEGRQFLLALAEQQEGVARRDQLQGSNSGSRQQAHFVPNSKPPVPCVTDACCSPRSATSKGAPRR